MLVGGKNRRAASKVVNCFLPLANGTISPSPTARKRSVGFGVATLSFVPPLHTHTHTTFSFQETDRLTFRRSPLKSPGKARIKRGPSRRNPCREGKTDRHRQRGKKKEERKEEGEQPWVSRPPVPTAGWEEMQEGKAPERPPRLF